VTACPRISYLYISDWESDCIWRVSPVDGGAERLIRDVGRAPRLSATVDGELVTATDRGVTVYSAVDGSRLRHLPIDGDARHAVMSSAAQSACFVVCQYTRHQVCSQLAISNAASVRFGPAIRGRYSCLSDCRKPQILFTKTSTLL